MPTITDYVYRIKSSGFSCFWAPAGKWIKAHGDGKSTTGGVFKTETMKGHDGMYHVRVIKDRHHVVLGPLKLSTSVEPSDEDVVEVLQDNV